MAQRPSSASVMVPAGAGATAMGAAAAYNPLAGAGIGGMLLLTFLPWAALFTVFVVAAMANKWGWVISGTTLRAAQLVLIPFALRAYLLTKQEMHPRWRWPEWMLFSFLGLQIFTTRFNAAVPRQSYLSAGILFLGGLAYLCVYLVSCSRERLILVAKIVLVTFAIGAGIGIASLFLHFATGLNYGIDTRFQAQLGGAPSVDGLAYEHDIFGSTCGFAAIAFLVLLREGDGQPVFKKRRSAMIGFWVCLIGMVLSLARGAWVGFAVGLVAMYLIRRRVRKPSRMVRAGLVLLMLGLLGTGLIWAFSGTDTTGTSGTSIQSGIAISVQQQASNILNFSTGTGAGRINKWKTAIRESWEESPLVGLGTNSYGERHFHPSPHTWPYLQPAYIESLYIRTFYDSGLIGLALLLAFLGWLVWPNKTIRSSLGDLNVVARAFLFGWVVIGVAFAATDSMLLLWPWIPLGVLRAAKEMANRQYGGMLAANARARAAGGTGNGFRPPPLPRGPLAPAGQPVT